MQLDLWIRTSRKTISKDVQSIRKEIIAMANDTHGTHLPATQTAIKALRKIR